MNICAGNEFAYFDSIMKVTYDSLLLYLSPDKDEDQKKYLGELRSKLVLSQEKWEEYMLCNAAYVAREYEGGTIRPMMIAMQKTMDTQARIAALKSLRGNF
jgi:uncharacterized protein YecT (DUF1311 family)